VVRYFGGTKLGVSGLIETYKETAKQIVESTTVIELAIKELFTVRCSYFELDKLYKILTKTKARILEQTIENECKFVVEIEKENISEFIKATNNGGIFLV
jgi:putative IMPACT (imprinted ancient) family translation regulator